MKREVNEKFRRKSIKKEIIKTLRKWNEEVVNVNREKKERVKREVEKETRARK